MYVMKNINTKVDFWPHRIRLVSSQDTKYSTSHASFRIHHKIESEVEKTIGRQLSPCVGSLYTYNMFGPFRGTSQDPRKKGKRYSAMPKIKKTKKP